jgi:PAS domain S-box-containing protein
VTGHDNTEAVVRLAAIVNSSDDAIVSKTLDGVITSWNPAAERMFGYTAAEAVGRSITLIIPFDRLSEEDEVLRRLRRGETVDHYETIRVRKDGALRNISVTVSPVRNAAGEIVGASKIARDITAQREAEAERGVLLAREQAARADAEKANRIKDEFLATLSHELRTPLNAILGWTRMLRARSLDPETSDRALETIDRNIQLLTRLVEDVLDVSRITTGTMRLDTRPVGLVPVIEAAVESVRPAARAKGIQIGVFLDSALGPVAGDASRLQQVVWNLVSNAIKFTPRDGRVEVHLEEHAWQAEIRVVDTGKGIAAEFLPRVFDRFTQADSSRTRAHSGLGLGLAIVRHLAELHGGTVSAESAGEGRGTTFTVRLPLLAVQASSPGSHARPRPGAGALSGIRLLVVEDDDDSRILLLAVLRDAGATAEAAGSVPEALAALDWAAPDVILCDISMPGQDGFDLLRQVRRRSGALGGVPIVALTARAREEERNETLAAGFTSHIAKPADPARLVREVARLAGRSGPLT